MNINNLEQSIKSLESEVSELKGSIKLLETQYSDTIEKLSILKEDQIVNLKSIELLNLVQKSTKDLICNIFETIVSNALQYVYQSNDYKFQLEFDKRGNIPKMSFQLKTPDMQESHDIYNCRAGGSKDIIALALRLVLLEVSKNQGFLFLDEPFKRLDNEETINKIIDFIKEIQKDTNKQIFMITHKKEVVESTTNPIIINNKQCSLFSEHLKKVNIKRKRGRPKKEKE